MFFAVFEMTRKAAKQLKKGSLWIVDRFSQQGGTLESKIRSHLPRIVNGLTLVTGGMVAGICYEFTGRPWDVARRTVHAHAAKLPLHQAPTVKDALQALTTKLKEEGLISYFRDVSKTKDRGKASRLTILLRMLGRLGPWGVGFLAWEAFGPGITV